MQALTYENEARQRAVVAALSAHLEAGEFVVSRHPYRWMRHSGDGPWSVISNAYESCSIQQICADNRWDLVHDYGHVAVVRPAQEARDE